MKPMPIFISHLGLQHIQKQKNSKRVGYKILKFCLYYNRMTQRLFFRNCQISRKPHANPNSNSNPNPNPKPSPLTQKLTQTLTLILTLIPSLAQTLTQTLG